MAHGGLDVRTELWLMKSYICEADGFDFTCSTRYPGRGDSTRYVMLESLNLLECFQMNSIVISDVQHATRLASVVYF